MSHLRGPRNRLAGLLLLLVAACSGNTPVLERIVLRLDASYFEPGPRDPHHPVAKIGRQAREVIHAPKRIFEVYEARAIFRHGLFRMHVELPQAVRALPEEAFVLSVRPLPGKASQWTPETLLTPYLRLEKGWRLLRDAGDPGHAIVELQQQPQDRGTSLNVRLEAFASSPAQLESRPFDLDDGSVFEMGYGVVPGRRRVRGEVRFVADLSCDGRAPLSLLSDAVASQDEDSHWHDVRVPVPQGGAQCRLHLQAGHGSDAGGASVWAVPRIYASQHTTEPELWNVVLISLDTLAADHMSIYGYSRETMPRLTELLARRGTVFENAITTFPRTDRAHLSLFTSLYPSALPHRPDYLAPEAPVRTLAEALRDAGFDTAAVTEDGLVAGARGFWFGFDHFTERHTVGGKASETFADGIHWLRKFQQRRFFLFLHTYEVHGPYHVPREYEGLFRELDPGQLPANRPRQPQKIAERYDDYDRMIRETDDIVAVFLEELERLGLAQRTLVILLSDHGESYKEHGALGHGYTGHREELHVPLILRGPGIPAERRVETNVSLVDVAPTLLQILGLPALPHAQGVSLTSQFGLRPVALERPIYFEWLRGGVGIRSGVFKWMRPGKARIGTLYDRGHDPWEKHPLTGRSALRRRLRDQVQRYRKRSTELAGTLETVDFSDFQAVDPELLEVIRGLGYVE